MKKNQNFKIGDSVLVKSGANCHGYDNKKGKVVQIDLNYSHQPCINIEFSHNGQYIWCYPDKYTEFEVDIIKDRTDFDACMADGYALMSKRAFDTGSVRDSNAGKPRVADILPYTRQRFGYHMLLGAEKYGEGNFQLGQPDKSSFESIHRHLADLESGNMSEDHASAIIFGVQLIMQNQQREGVAIDEFYNKLKTK